MGLQDYPGTIGMLLTIVAMILVIFSRLLAPRPVMPLFGFDVVLLAAVIIIIAVTALIAVEHGFVG